MTLYLLFERLEAGKIRLDSQMEVSAHASVQSPTKLGVRPGQTLMVEDAIKALVTKSGQRRRRRHRRSAWPARKTSSRSSMTRKARALRMTRTVYKNASGLPNSIRSPRRAIRPCSVFAIQDRFPRYYRYFATESFAYRGVRMANHNRAARTRRRRNRHQDRLHQCLRLQSGQRRAARRSPSCRSRARRRIGGARDAKMRSLIEQKISLASVKRTAPKIVESRRCRQQQCQRLSDADRLAGSGRATSSVLRSQRRACSSRASGGTAVSALHRPRQPFRQSRIQHATQRLRNRTALHPARPSRSSRCW